MQKLLQYICHGTKPAGDDEIQHLDTIVRRIKDKEEVNRAYMRTSELEYYAREDERIKARHQDALSFIRSARITFHATDEQILSELIHSFSFDPEEATELLAAADEAGITKS